MNRPTARPPFDPELAAVLEELAEVMPPTFTADMIPLLRQGADSSLTLQALDEADIERRDVTIRGHDGGEIVVSVLRSAGRAGTGPGIYFIHGGGMISGDRWTGVTAVAEWLHRYNAVAVTVDYRLSPEHPDPTPVEDCYAGLEWMAGHADELGVDPDRLLIVGGSAGAGLAAGVTLAARDRRGPKLVGSMLFYPMLDDRDATVSTTQIDGVGVWDRTTNSMGWTALLGERKGGDDVSIYAAPARATDLSDLPPTFIDCGSAEVFRDEDIAYAQAIWAAGGDAELHVWPGGFHAFEMLAPQSRLAQEMNAARDNWLARILG